MDLKLNHGLSIQNKTQCLIIHQVKELLQTQTVIRSNTISAAASTASSLTLKDINNIKTLFRPVM